MDTMSQPTCEERIAGELKDRLTDFAHEFKLMDVDDQEVAESASENLQEMPLSVERLTVWRIDLSTGGPADWFEYHIDSKGDIKRIEYHFADWFDHASRTLEGDEFDVAEQFGRHVTGDFYTE